MVSLGYLNYDMSRTHSIMRVATTASPISGSEVCTLRAVATESGLTSVLRAGSKQNAGACYAQEHEIRQVQDARLHPEDTRATPAETAAETKAAVEERVVSNRTPGGEFDGGLGSARFVAGSRRRPSVRKEPVWRRVPLWAPLTGARQGAGGTRRAPDEPGAAAANLVPSLQQERALGAAASLGSAGGLSAKGRGPRSRPARERGRAAPLITRAAPMLAPKGTLFVP